MGNVCLYLRMLFEPKSLKSQIDQLPISTNRKFDLQKLTQETPQTRKFDQKKYTSSDQKFLSSTQDAKQIPSKQTFNQSCNFKDNKCHSMNQEYIDKSSLLIINPRSKINQSAIDSAQYYTLIDKVAFVKKTTDPLKVTTPAGTSELYCQPQFMTSTLFIAQGIPLETLPEAINTQGRKSLVQIQNSPIRLVLKLSCLQCQKKIKLTYCKAYISILEIKCPKCETLGKWRLLDIQSNFPIWGEGRRIIDHESFQSAPSQFRLLGCVICFKFSNLRKIQSCGCYVCKNCERAGQQTYCPLCNPFQI